MKVRLTKPLEQLIARKVKSGEYASPSEVMQDALRLLKQRDKANAEKIKALRTMVDAGLASLDQGKGVPMSKAFAMVRRRSRARRGKAA